VENGWVMRYGVIEARWGVSFVPTKIRARRSQRPRSLHSEPVMSSDLRFALGDLVLRVRVQRPTMSP
jgi:hypothetical protein